MSKGIRRYIIISAGTFVAGLILACGGTNNDQGVSVTFVGLYGVSAVVATGTPAITPTSTTTTTNQQQSTGCATLPSVTTRPTFTLASPRGSVNAVAVIQNNLSGQFFRTSQLTLDFFIAGASVQPPSYSTNISILAGPAEAAFGNSGSGTGTNGGTNGNQGLRRPQNTSLPPTFLAICNTQTRQIPLLPAETVNWLLLNSDYLPPAPYTIDVDARFFGTSSAGDVFETNSVYIPIEILPRESSASAQSELAADPYAEGGDAPSDSGEGDTGGELSAQDPEMDFIEEQ